MFILYRFNAQRISDRNTTLDIITPYAVEIFEPLNDTKGGGHLCSYAGDNGLFCHFDRPTLFSVAIPMLVGLSPNKNKIKITKAISKVKVVSASAKDYS
jgi:hypothetical protein